MEDNKMKENSFIGYEYRSIDVKKSMASLYVDGYENFGWKLEGSEYPITGVETVTLKFKRDRKICNKAELTRLQRNFDACVSEIQSLEGSKYLKASVAAYSVGIVGTAFMAGSVFAVTSNLIVPCIILAVPAFIGWALPYFLYKNISKKRTEEITPLIEKKYDDIYSICEKANALLGTSDSV